MEGITFALLSIAAAIIFLALKGNEMAVDFTSLNDALDAVAAGLQEVADAIANPPADQAAAQQAVNDAASKLQGFASQLQDMKVAEEGEDAGA